MGRPQDDPLAKILVPSVLGEYGAAMAAFIPGLIFIAVLIVIGVFAANGRAHMQAKANMDELERRKKAGKL